MHHQKSKSKSKSQHNVMNVSTESATETKKTKRSIVAQDVGASGDLSSSPKPEQNLESTNSASQLLRNKKDWSLIAGFVSGGVTNALLHPIDSVKTRMQASGRGQACGATSKTTFVDTVRFTRDMIRTEGWTSLYQGMVSSVIGASFSWGIYFYVYKMSKLYGKTWSEKLSTSTESESENIGKSDSDSEKTASIPTSVLLLSSLNAGFATCMLTHPIWLVKTRLQLQHNVGKQANGASPVSYRGTVDAFLKIARNEGVFRGLYAGLTPSLVLISHGVIHFVLYDVLKDMRLRHIDDSKETEATEQRKEQLNSRDSLIIAAFSKSVAATVTYPFQVVKTRLQDVQNSVAYRSIAHPSMATTTNHQNQVYYTGMVDAMRKMYRMEGVGSFFRGIVPNVIRVTPAGALTLAIYEYFLHFSMTGSSPVAT